MRPSASSSVLVRRARHRGAGLVLAIAYGCGSQEFSTGSPSLDASPEGTGGAPGVDASGDERGGSAGQSRDAAEAAVDVEASTPPPRNSGDCDTAGDCGGDPCVELIASGYRVCATRVVEARSCSTPAGQCCKSADCADAGSGAVCVAGPLERRCSPPTTPTNACATPGCASAADCSGANAVCAPAGTLGGKAARCVAGGCRFDRECTAEPGGICVPVADPCCADVVAGLFCVYPGGGGCRSNADCKNAGERCVNDGQRAFCMAGATSCPDGG